MKKFLSIALAIFLLVGCVCATHATNIEGDSGEMNFDVVFAIDGSGSMKHSDPSKLAAEAAKLFVDMCDQKTCRAGYVVYSHEICASQELVSLKDKDTLKELKNSLSDIEYPSNADTDIALGLTEAMRIILKDKQDGRNPMIVLLSDGNTDLPHGPRTEEESDAELQETLKALKKQEIPVYTIGLNYDGSLDTSAMDNISSATRGKSYKTKSANSLPEIINQIFADFNRISIVDCDIKWNDANSRYSITIPITNSSVYIANIVVLSEKGVSDPKLYTPGGTQVALNSDQAQLKQSEKYTLVKMVFPESGEWTLSLKGSKNDDISVSLLNTYSLALQQSFDKETYAVGDEVTIKVGMFNDDSEDPISDRDLLSQLQATCNVTDGDGKELTTLSMTSDGDGYFTATYPIESSGNYAFVSKVIGNNGAFEKVSGKNVISVGVQELVLEEDSLSVSVYSKPLSSTTEIDIGEYVTWDNTLTLSAVPEFDVSNDTIELTEKDDSQTPILVIKGIHPGSVSIPVKIQEGDLNSQTLTLNVKVKNSIFIIIGILVAIIALGFIIWRIILARRPKLPAQFELTINIPTSSEIPQPAKQNVSTPLHVATCSLMDAIKADSNAQFALQTVIDKFSLFDFLSKCRLAGGKNGQLVVKVPAIKGEIIQFNSRNITKGSHQVTLNKNSNQCTITLDQHECVLIIKIAGNTSDFSSDSGFGFNNGGFGFGSSGSGFNDGGFGFGSDSSGANNGGFGFDGDSSGSNDGGFGFGGDNSGSRDSGFGFGGDSSGSNDGDFGFGGDNSGSRDSGFGFGGDSSGSRDSGFGFGGDSSGSRDSGFGFGGDSSGSNDGGFGFGNDGFGSSDSGFRNDNFSSNDSGFGFGNR